MWSFNNKYQYSNDDYIGFRIVLIVTPSRDDPIFWRLRICFGSVWLGGEKPTRVLMGSLQRNLNMNPLEVIRRFNFGNLNFQVPCKRFWELTRSLKPGETLPLYPLNRLKAKVQWEDWSFDVESFWLQWKFPRVIARVVVLAPFLNDENYMVSVDTKDSFWYQANRDQWIVKAKAESSLDKFRQGS